MSRRTPSGSPRLGGALLAVALLGAFLLGAPGAAAADEPRPLLVTVDDLPLARALHPDPDERRQLTDDLLTVLRRHQIRAVGLVTWGNVASDADRELLDRWLAAGHELGNHSFHHPSYTRTEIEPYLEDVEAARRELAAFLGERQPVRFFRFPQLHEGDTAEKLAAMRHYLAASGQRNLPVTLDNADWTFEQPWVRAERAGDRSAMERVAEEYHDSLRLSIRHHERAGDALFARPVPQILLLHATAVSAAQWDRLFTWLAARGYRFAGADEVLADPAFSEEHGYIGDRGLSLWDRLRIEREARAAATEVERVLADQAAAWSRGDLEDFTSVYAEDAVFIAATGVTRGRQEVLDRYRRRYGDPAAMGTLTLEVLDFRPVRGLETSMVGDTQPGSLHATSVVARWRLSYPEGSDRDNAEGLTLLVLHRTADGWKIVHDASM